MRFVFTAGGTREPVDAVRHMSNVATGSLPAAIANALLHRGHAVDYIHGPGALTPGTARANIDVVSTPNVEAVLENWLHNARQFAASLESATLRLYPIETAVEAAEKLREVAALSDPDAVVCAMAVADFAPVFTPGKLSSQLGELVVRMQPTPKTIDVVRSVAPNTMLWGFKLLSNATPQQRAAACGLLCERSGADFVVCNDMADYTRGVRRGWLYAAGGALVQPLGDEATDVEGFATAIANALLSQLAGHVKAAKKP